MIEPNHQRPAASDGELTGHWAKQESIHVLGRHHSPLMVIDKSIDECFFLLLFFFLTCSKSKDSGSGEDEDGVSSEASRSPSPAEMERSYSSEGSSGARGPASAQGQRSSTASTAAKGSSSECPTESARLDVSTDVIIRFMVHDDRVTCLFFRIW